MPHLRTNWVEQNKIQTQVNLCLKKKYCPRLASIWMDYHVHLLDPLGWPLLLFMYSTLFIKYLYPCLLDPLSIFFLLALPIFLWLNWFLKFRFLHTTHNGASTIQNRLPNSSFKAWFKEQRTPIFWVNEQTWNFKSMSKKMFYDRDGHSSHDEAPLCQKRNIVIGSSHWLFDFLSMPLGPTDHWNIKLFYGWYFTLQHVGFPFSFLIKRITQELWAHYYYKQHIREPEYGSHVLKSAVPMMIHVCNLLPVIEYKTKDMDEEMPLKLTLQFAFILYSFTLRDIFIYSEIN